MVNNDYEAGDDSSSYTNNIWMLNDFPQDDDDASHPNEFEKNRSSATFKRKLSNDVMSDENEHSQQSPSANASSKKLKRCRFWPDCHNGDQCEFVHPAQRCT